MVSGVLDPDEIPKKKPKPKKPKSQKPKKEGVEDILDKLLGDDIDLNLKQSRASECQ